MNRKINISAETSFGGSDGCFWLQRTQVKRCYTASPRGYLAQPEVPRAPSQTAQDGAGRANRAYRAHTQGAVLGFLLLLHRLFWCCCKASQLWVSADRQPDHFIQSELPTSSELTRIWMHTELQEWLNKRLCPKVLLIIRGEIHLHRIIQLILKQGELVTLEKLFSFSMLLDTMPKFCHPQEAMTHFQLQLE